MSLKVCDKNWKLAKKHKLEFYEFQVTLLAYEPPTHL